MSLDITEIGGCQPCGVFSSKSFLIKNKNQMLEIRGMLPWSLLHRVNLIPKMKQGFKNWNLN